MKTFDILIKINEAFNVLSVAINLAKYDYLPLSGGYREDYKFSISSIVSKCCEIDHKFGFEDREVGLACCDTAVYDARETLVHLMENRSNIRRVNSKIKNYLQFCRRGGRYTKREIFMKDIQFQPPPDHITYPAFKTGGLERGEMTIITAPSREGKSAFEVGIMINIKEAKAYDV